VGAQATPAPGASANPFAVDASQPLDVLMWDVGWGDEYALNALEIYKALYPASRSSTKACSGCRRWPSPASSPAIPPDVIEATQLDRPSLAADGQLADLSDLLAAPAYDTAGATLAETLRPGTQVDAVLDGVPYAVNFSYGTQGLWYNAITLAENGWEYPTTWERCSPSARRSKPAASPRPGPTKGSTRATSRP
jgi:N-acetylglucosamine transport system substrate-binding protein